MMYTFLMNCMFINLMFITLKHPMSVGFMLLMQTINVSIICSFMNYSFWMSYILFLIMIGGMLILFIYMTSIVSNEKFFFSMKYNLIISLIMVFMIIFMFTDNTWIYQMIKNMETTLMENKFNLNLENMFLNKIYNKPNNLITIILINYLFMALVIVVKITNMNFGPLRQKF